MSHQHIKKQYKIAIALSLAQAKMSFGEHQRQYICDAIQAGVLEAQLPEEYANVAVEHVMKALFPHKSMELWLVANGIPPSHLTPTRVKAHRIAWIEKMVKELTPQQVPRIPNGTPRQSGRSLW